MSRPIIEVQNLSKRYRLGAISATSLRDEFHRTWDRLRGLHPSDPQDFWALRDVSFEVRPGEVLGIIGRNGAGKSTLLKILSRITEPTSGKAIMRGRVASLLEVGTGFHPELSGRDNIFLNGAILGMTRAEVRGKFDEIVSFAEVEKFIDTPVKRYSSGMYVRLAFAVAAHLEPEILIIDEVLAVGDAEFQKKCLGKMQSVSSDEGRTVLFVSHNIEATCTLCSHCLLFSGGRLVAYGEPAQIVGQYLAADQATATNVTFTPRDSDARFRSAQLCDITGRTAGCFATRTSVVVKCEFEVSRPVSGLQVAFALFNFRGERLFYSSNETAQPAFSIASTGMHCVSATIPPNLLLPGRYFVNIALHRPNAVLFELREQALSFDVIPPAADDRRFSGSGLGVVHVDVQWRQETISP